ncbi:MAG: hypothetical protein WB443_01370 [Nitrososphaeraceae archaeon]
MKKLGKNGSWNAISLIDKNGSFRGEARFESKREAQKYLEEYKNKMKSPQDLKIFSDQSPNNQNKKPGNG